MAKSILAIITILALSTSGALAAQRTRHRHASPALLQSERGLNAYAVGPGNSNDRAMYIKNLRDSGYNPKNKLRQVRSITERRFTNLHPSRCRTAASRTPCATPPTTSRACRSASTTRAGPSRPRHRTAKVDRMSIWSTVSCTGLRRVG